MGKRNATRVTAQDIARAEGGVEGLIKQLVKRITDGEHDLREGAAAQICSLAVQNHGEHCVMLHNKGAVKPLVKLLSEGSAKSQASACGALHAIALAKEQHQATLVEKGGVKPLVRLLKTGSPKVQEQVKICALRAASDASCCTNRGTARSHSPSLLSPRLHRLPLPLRHSPPTSPIRSTSSRRDVSSR